MKNKAALFGLLALLLATGMVLAGCEQPSGSSGGGGSSAAPAGGGTKLTVAELAAYLQSLPVNIAGTPYTVALAPGTVINTESTSSTGVWATINSVVQNEGKFVILDLSECSASGNTISGAGSSPSGNKMNIIKNNPYIKGIILPNSLTSIGNHAFQYCSSLTSITIPSGVTSIGDVAFSFCSSLTSVTIPSSVFIIDTGAFMGCSSLTSVTIPSSVFIIEGSAFTNNLYLTSVIFGSGSNIASGNFGSDNFGIPFEGNLKTVYLAANPHSGTYTRAAGGSTWTKQ